MSKKEINILVDERPMRAFLGYTIMQTCSDVGVDIPRFCYHDKLLIAGNCRICLIEVAGSKKLVAACAVHISENMSIFTNTARVRLARQNVLEFLLANHPLDCPICDQGGECDLQDITALFGADRGRFYEQEKRAVLNKDFGPLIRTSMNRCIHCTRCVRFLAMSSGFALLGTMGRGSSTEISLYVNQFISDELSGNITDLCPVGALTSKPYSFKARPWELVSISSVDVFDSMNSSLTFDVMANTVCRVLPYANDSINECWLTNKARYAYDGLFVQRLSACLLKTSLEYFFREKFFSKKVLQIRHSVFVRLAWNAALSVVLSTLFAPLTKAFILLIGNSVDLEAALSAKMFSNALGSNSFFFETSNESPMLDFSFLFLFNSSLLTLNKLPSFCLLVGSNLRFEAPILNLKLTNLVAEFGVNVYKIGGSSFYAAHKTINISNKLTTFLEICEFKHVFCKNFYLADFRLKPFILLGSAFCALRNSTFGGFSVINFVRRLFRGSAYTRFQLPESGEFNFFGFVPQYSAQIHALDVGLTYGIQKFKNFSSLISEPSHGSTNVFYSVGFESRLPLNVKNRIPFLVYQGSHGNGLASQANIVFPSISYVERTGFYKNLLGVVQKLDIVVNYSFGALSDLDIFKNLLNFSETLLRKQFFLFTFNSAIRFNFSLLMPVSAFTNSEIFFTKNILTLFPFLPKLFFTKCYKQINKFFYYLCVYNFFALDTCNLKFLKSVGTLGVENSSKIFSNLVSSPVVNYYGDNSSVILASSKTMSLCSNLLKKKNFSFSSTYF